ncbi:putative efflux pump component MtrF [Vibrio parahaemolyticus Peru-466]|nr:putative efflux pump component MtrF [Vibrio parahaemolyticus Peru-466]
MSSSASIKQNSPKKPLFTRFLDTVEYLGNLLPHPITLFAIFCLAILVMSGIAGYFEVSVVDPRPEGAKGRAADGMIQVVSLLNADGLELIVTNLVKNFVGFAPLGTVLVAMLGVAIAEYSGLLSAAMRGLVMGASQRMVTVRLFCWYHSNTASELATWFYPTAACFPFPGRHLLLSAAAFAGVSGGYSANF